MPNIESGNIVGKALIYCSNAKMAGVILGVSYPIILTSRAENAEGKLNSLALACLSIEKEK
jgi:phosphate butyryltransferase